MALGKAKELVSPIRCSSSGSTIFYIWGFVVLGIWIACNINILLNLHFCSNKFCPYCVCVKQLFVLKLGVQYKAIELDQESDGIEIQSALAEWTGQQTLPNVFVGGNYIGDCDATCWDLHKEGSLVPLLTEAGIVAKFQELEIS